MPITIGQPAALHVGDARTLTGTWKDKSGIPTDLSDAAELAINFERPDGTSFDRPAELVTDGTDGRYACALEVNDLDVDGYWRLQPRATFSGSALVHGNAERTRVYRNNAAAT